MERYQAILAYDGTSFWGFQAQPGFRTVEGELRSALKTLGWRGKTLLSGGRTDAGVHAEGQVAAFDLEWAHATEELHRALNALLPGDISCQVLRVAAPDFHPRYNALRRCYRYRLLPASERDPLRERYALRVWPAPDFERMAEAARALPGTRDFRAFGSAPRKGSHTVRTVFRADWERLGDCLDFGSKRMRSCSAWCGRSSERCCSWVTDSEGWRSSANCWKLLRREDPHRRLRHTVCA